MKIGDIVTTPDGRGVIKDIESYNFGKRYGVHLFSSPAGLQYLSIRYYLLGELKSVGDIPSPT